MSGREVSQSECAAVFGVHRNTVAAWLKKECPYVQKANKSQGRDWVLNTADVAQWREETAVQRVVGDISALDAEELKKRKLAAETTISEIDAAKALGDVATLDEIKRQWVGTIMELRARMQLIPKRASLSLVGKNNKREIESIIYDEVCHALETVADQHDASE